jgi:peptidoglycan/xylan/chitin deacetylase (PgdA/CDA1 family)
MIYFAHASRKKIITILSLCSMTTGIAIQEIYGGETPRGLIRSLSSSLSTQPLPEKMYTKPSQGTLITIPVIVYHSVRPSFPEETAEMKKFSTEPHILEQELAYLKNNNYHVISFREMLDYFDHGVPIPSQPVILTFDDGWKNQYLYAFPLLKKYGFTATFFVFTNAIGHKNYLSWNELREMSVAGMTIGGHTKTHPYLTKIADQETLANEVDGGKKTLEKHLGGTIETFAYPFGLSNKAVVQEVVNAGYRIGRTSSAGSIHAENNLLLLPALYDQNSLSVFIKLLNTQ